MAVYLALAFLLVLPLLGPGYYVALDLAVGPNTFSDFQFGELYGYVTNPYGAYMPLNLVLAALSKAVPVELLEKGLLFLVLFLCGACMHRSLPGKLGDCRYFAGFLYMLNPFVFVRFLAGHWALLLSYALWPLAIKVFSDFLDKPQDRGRLASAALITAFASVSSHGVLMLLLCYAALFVMRARNGMPLLRQTALLAILVLAMNLFWIAPALLAFGHTYAPASATAYLEDFGASGGHMPLELAVLSMHGFWRAGFTLTKDVFSLWYVPFAAIALLAALGFAALLKKDRALAASLAAAFAIAFLLALGLEGPLGWVFTSLPQQFSLFFRDSQKFVGLIALAYSVLGAYGAHYITEHFPQGRYRPLIPLALLLIPVIYNYGFFGFLGQTGPTAYPNGWAQADSIIAADKTDTSILVLPPHFYSGYYWINSTQKTAGAPAIGFFSKPVVMPFNVETEHVYTDTTDPSGRYLSWLFENRQFVNNTAELLLPLGARYILLFKGDDESPHYLYLFQRKAGVPHIELVFENDELWLFRNGLATGPLFASAENGSGEPNGLLGSGPYSPNVSYEGITPASFRVLSSPYPYVVLTSSQPWLIRSGDAAASSWHGIGSAFPFSGPAVIENRMFYLTLALFLLSWMVMLGLLAGISPVRGAALAAGAAVLYLLASAGLLAPHLIGALFLASVCAAIFLRFRRPSALW